MAHENDMTRRDFLRTLTVIGTSATAVMAVAAVAAPPTPKAKGEVIGKVSDFKPDQFKKVVLQNGQSLYVRKNGAGFLALSDKCTHKGCPVTWAADTKVFKCPCHGGQFDINGKNIAGPPPTPLATYPTKVVKGTVLVQV